MNEFEAEMRRLDSLPIGDEVVTAGQLKIRDGAPVQPLGGAEA